MEDFPEKVVPQLQSDSQTEAKTDHVFSFSQIIVFELGLETQCPNTVFIYPKHVCPNLEMAGNGGCCPVF